MKLTRSTHQEFRHFVISARREIKDRPHAKLPAKSFYCPTTIKFPACAQNNRLPLYLYTYMYIAARWPENFLPTPAAAIKKRRFFQFDVYKSLAQPAIVYTYIHIYTRIAQFFSARGGSNPLSRYLESCFSSRPAVATAAAAAGVIAKPYRYRHFGHNRRPLYIQAYTGCRAAFLLQPLTEKGRWVPLCLAAAD